MKIIFKIPVLFIFVSGTAFAERSILDTIKKHGCPWGYVDNGKGGCEKAMAIVLKKPINTKDENQEDIEK